VTVSHKVALSLVIAVSLFVGFTILAYRRFFGLMETRFYNPSVMRTLNREIHGDAKTIEAFLGELQDRFADSLQIPAVQRSFLPNQSAEDIYERSRLYGLLLASPSGLQGARFIDAGGVRIHYSTYEADILRRDRTSIAYRNYQAGPNNLPYETVAVPNQGLPKISVDAAGEGFIFSFPFYDSHGVYRGTALFALSAKALADCLTLHGRLKTGEGIAVLNPPPGMVAGLPAGRREALIPLITRIWNNGTLALTPLDLTEAGLTLNLISSQTSQGVYWGRLVDEALFVFPLGMRYILLVSFFFTSYLTVFLLLNLRQDAMTRVKERITSLKVSLIADYRNRRGAVDWRQWSRELEQRREDLRRDIKQSLKPVKRNKKLDRDIDVCIDTAWHELTALIKCHTEDQLEPLGETQIQDIVNRVLTASALRLPETPAALPLEDTAGDALTAVEPAETLEDAEPVEELDAWEELEEAEVLEEVDDWEELEAQPAAKAPETTPIAEESAAKAPETTPTAEELVVEAPEITPTAENPVAKIPETMPTVEEPAVKAPGTTLIAKNPVVKALETTPAVENPAAKAPETTPAVEEPAAKALKTAPTVEEPAVKVLETALMAEEPAAKTPETAPIAENPATQSLETALAVEKPAAQNLETMPIAEEPAAKAPETTPAVENPAAKVLETAPMAEEPAAKTPETTPAVEESAVEVLETAPMAEEPAAKAPEITPAVENSAAKVLETALAVEKPAAQNLETMPIAEEPAAKAPETTPTAENPVAKTPETTPTVEEPAAKTPETTPAVEEPVAKTPETTPAVKEPAVKALKTTPAVEEPAAKALKTTPAVEEPAAKALKTKPAAETLNEPGDGLEELEPLEEADRSTAAADALTAPPLSRLNALASQIKFAPAPEFESVEELPLLGLEIVSPFRDLYSELDEQGVKIDNSEELLPEEMEALELEEESGGLRLDQGEPARPDTRDAGDEWKKKTFLHG
jgi:hypothetical protein